MNLCYLNISISKNIVPDNIRGREIHHSFPMTLFQVFLNKENIAHSVLLIFLVIVRPVTGLVLATVSGYLWMRPSLDDTAHTVRLNHHTLKLLKYWTWQFVVIHPMCSILMISLQLLGIYPSWVSWTFTTILNISVSLALYSLVVCYHVFTNELEPHKPPAKFLYIKGIVLFCFWQGILAMAIIKSNYFWLDVEQIEEALQNALVCVEMVFLSAFQRYAYGVCTLQRRRHYANL